MYSCSNFRGSKEPRKSRTISANMTTVAFGFFNAFGNSARKDSVDYVLHLGDYIYEYKNGDYGWGQSISRVPLPGSSSESLGHSHIANKY